MLTVKSIENQCIATSMLPVKVSNYHGSQLGVVHFMGFHIMVFPNYVIPVEDVPGGATKIGHAVIPSDPNAGHGLVLWMHKMLARNRQKVNLN